MSFQQYLSEKLNQLDLIVRNKQIPLKCRRNMIRDWLIKDRLYHYIDFCRSFFVIFPHQLPTHSTRRNCRHEYVHLYISIKSQYQDYCKIRNLHYLHVDSEIKSYIASSPKLSANDVGDVNSINQTEADLITQIQATALLIQQSISQLLTISNINSKIQNDLNTYSQMLNQPSTWTTDESSKHDVLSSIDLLHLINNNLGVINALMSRDIKYQDPPSNSALKTMISQFGDSFHDESKIISNND